MIYILLILLVILYPFDFIGFLNIPLGDPTQPPLEKGRGRSGHISAVILSNQQRSV
jgi:hypothetical protein